MLFQNKKKQQVDPNIFDKAKGMLRQEAMPNPPAAQAQAAQPAFNPSMLQRTKAPTPQTLGRADPVLERAQTMMKQPDTQLQASPIVDRNLVQRNNPMDGVTIQNPKILDMIKQDTPPTPPQSDGDRVNAIRNKVGVSVRGPQVIPPTGPRVGSTPFNENTNQTDLVPNFDTKVPTKNTDQMLEDLVRDLIKNDPAQNDASRQAMSTELDKKAAENLASVRSRMGLAGAGLTGAAGSIEGATQRADARNKTVTLDEQDRALRKEALDRAIAGAGMYNQGRSQDRGDRELDIREGEIDRHAPMEDAAFRAAMAMYEKELGTDIDGDGKIGGNTAEENKNIDRQKQVDQTNADPNNPMSAQNMMDFARETGGNVQQVKAWADAHGKPLTMAVLNQIKAKYKAYKDSRSDRSQKIDFGEWFKAELAVYAGGFNPASSLWGIL